MVGLEPGTRYIGTLLLLLYELNEFKFVRIYMVHIYIHAYLTTTRYSSSSSTSSSVLFFFSSSIAHSYCPASGQAVVTGVVSSPPRFLPSIFIAHRVQQSHCSSIFHLVLLTHALALSASQFVLKKKSPRIYASMHSGGFELTNLTYTRLEDNLIRTPRGRPALPGTRFQPDHWPKP